MQKIQGNMMMLIGSWAPDHGGGQINKLTRHFMHYTKIYNVEKTVIHFNMNVYVDKNRAQALSCDPYTAQLLA